MFFTKTKAKNLNEEFPNLDTLEASKLYYYMAICHITLKSTDLNHINKLFTLSYGICHENTDAYIEHQKFLSKHSEFNFENNLLVQLNRYYKDKYYKQFHPSNNFFVNTVKLSALIEQQFGTLLKCGSDTGDGGTVLHKKNQDMVCHY